MSPDERIDGTYLTSKEAREFTEAWVSEAKGGPCGLCSGIGIATKDDVPAWRAKLVPRVEYGGQILSTCPGCGTFYFYQKISETPDVMELFDPYEAELLYRWSREKVRDWMNVVVRTGLVRLREGGAQARRILKLDVPGRLQQLKNRRPYCCERCGRTVRDVKAPQEDSEACRDQTKAACPKCRSNDVRAIDTYLEFTKMRCDACGHEDVADEYQLMDWYR
jgi:hypothetical protein